MNNFIGWTRLHTVIAYFDSSSLGLGFIIWNCLLGMSQNGLISKIVEWSMRLKQIFSMMTRLKIWIVSFAKINKWPWNIRSISPKSFLAKFPPRKKVEDHIEFPTFHLPIDGVSVNVVEWISSIDPFGELVEAWVKAEGMPPKEYSWKILAQIASCFVILVDVH